MSEEIGTALTEVSHCEINDQVINVHTTVCHDFKSVGYVFKCDTELSPEVIAIALWLTAKDIAQKLNIEIDDFAKQMVQSEREH